MKKIYLVSLITLILGFIFTLKPDWFAFLWGWQIMLLPLIAGIFMVLVQDEDKSYHFLPKLIIGSILTSLVFVIIWQIMAYDPGAKLYIPEALYTTLYFSAVMVFGGLMGVVIRGATLLIQRTPKGNRKSTSIILGILIIVLIVALLIISNLFTEKEKKDGNEGMGINGAPETLEINEDKYLSMNEKDIESNLPDSFKANYISFSNYVSNVFKAEEYPKLESWVENGKIECAETPPESSLPLRIRKADINGRKYCIAAASEGAAGSVYTQYSYTTVIKDNVYLINFVARYPNCSNYPDKERLLCEGERETFNLDNLVAQEVR